MDSVIFPICVLAGNLTMSPKWHNCHLAVRGKKTITDNHLSNTGYDMNSFTQSNYIAWWADQLLLVLVATTTDLSFNVMYMLFLMMQYSQMSFIWSQLIKLDHYQK